MTDHNKVRDEVCEAFADQRKDRKLGTKDNHEWVELVMAGRNAFDAAIAHLSKQSVEFDEGKAFEADIQFQKQPMSFRHAPFIDGARWQHQQTALIYEAKLAIAVDALRFYSTPSNWNECAVVAEEALEKLGAK